MYILIMKNHEDRTVLVEKYSPTEYPFPTVQQAEERGQELLKLKKDEKPVYKAFHTMELTHFIDSITKRFGLEV